MARKKDDSLEVVTVRLFKGDKDTISKFFPRNGYNPVIRALVRRYVRQLEAREAERRPTDDSPELDPNELDLSTCGDESANS